MGEGQIKDFLPLLQILKSSKYYKKNIISVVTYPFVNGKWIDISFLPENLRKNLLNIGIERLYPYQKRVYQVIKERKQPVASIKTQQIQSHRTSPTTTLPDSGKVERSTPQPQPPVSVKFITLRMITTDTCWIKLTRDNEEPGDTIFLPGAKRIWRAKEKFDIIIGKPAGIRLFLGNKDLGQVGINGIPVRLVITREGIIKKQTFRK